MKRRNFLQISTVSAALASMGLSINAEERASNKSVIWIWLSGGPTHVELWDPKMDAPSEYRAVNGSISGHDGIEIGADWVNLSKHLDKVNIVRSFTHTNSSHRTGTHWMMTGHNNTDNSPGSIPRHPSYGSVVSAIHGTNDARTGLPAYVRANNIDGDGASWLGGAYKPFDAAKEGKDNLVIKVPTNRFVGRSELLGILDNAKYAQDVTKYRSQARDVVLGQASKAFDISKESEEVRIAYGKGVGEQLLLARRLVEAGSKFISVNYGGWDMHSNISTSLKSRVPPLDIALSSLLNDLSQKGLLKDTLIVVAGEFGRTPKVNKNSGRDHWAKLSSLMLAGGDYPLGRVIGSSDSKVTYPATDPYGPIDVAATLFDHFGIDKNIQRIDNAGRPRYLLEGGKSIL
jgi:hypothetical protein